MRRSHPAALPRLVATGISATLVVGLAFAFARTDTTPARSGSGRIHDPSQPDANSDHGARPGRPGSGHPVTQTGAS